MAELSEAKELSEFIVHLRNRRAGVIDHRWLLSYNAWNDRKTRTFFRSDTFNHHVPAFRRATERAVTRTTQMILPSQDFFEVYPLDELSDEMGKRAEGVLNYEKYILLKKIKIRPVIQQLSRSFYLYGRAISKAGVRLENIAGRDYLWPTVRAIDVFSHYVWPETVSSFDEVQVFVEDNMMPFNTYKLLAERGITQPISLSDLEKPVWPTHIQERLGDQGFTNPSDAESFTKGKKSRYGFSEFVALSETWFRNKGEWTLKWLVWNLKGGERIVRTSKPTTGKHPYRGVTARPIPSEHYTTGMGDDVEPLQALVDDQINITLEGLATAIGSPTVVDPTRMSRSAQLTWRPRAKWLGEPEAVKQLAVPDISSSGIRGLQLSLGLIDNFSGSSPLAEGQTQRNMPRAGFAVSSLLNLSLADTREVAIAIEDEILTPLLGDIYALTQDVIPADQIIRIPGVRELKAARVTPKDLAGDWEFRWVGSLQAQDLQVRAQRLVTFLNVLTGVAAQAQRDLQTRGMEIDWIALLKRIWRDGLGERGADSIIRTIPQDEKMQRMILSLLQQEQAAKTGGPEGRRPSAPTSPGDVGEQLTRMIAQASGGMDL